MPRLTIEKFGTFEVSSGRRLVKAIEENGVDIGHRCGGNARCTTCRVAFDSGEPEKMTRAEFAKLSEKELVGEVRLSCQIVCEGDMSLKPLMRRSEMGWEDSGPEPDDDVMPEARWYSPDELKANPKS